MSETAKMNVPAKKAAWGAHVGLAALVLALAVFPLVAPLFDLDYYTGFVRRLMIVALAAASLNFLMGRVGLVALGHAGFVGVGAYAVAALAEAGWTSAWLIWAMAMLLGVAVSALIGLVALRTRGVYFIMITLAFAQMLFYIFISLRQYGGEDGLNLPGHSVLPGLDLGHDVSFYYVVLALFAVLMAVFGRLVDSRFGKALQGVRENESRMESLGYPVYRIKLAAFVLSGAVAGLAGALLANQSGFVSPALLQWNQSGLLLVMVILGGVGHLWGGFIGAVVFLLLEEILAAYTIHWQFGLGAVLLLVVLVAPQGLAGFLRRKKPA